MEYYLVIERREALTDMQYNMDGSEHMVLTERSQTQGHPACDPMCVECPGQAHPEARSGSVVAWGEEEGDGE